MRNSHHDKDMKTAQDSVEKRVNRSVHIIHQASKDFWLLVQGKELFTAAKTLSRSFSPERGQQNENQIFAVVDWRTIALTTRMTSLNILPEVAMLEDFFIESKTVERQARQRVKTIPKDVF